MKKLTEMPNIGVNLSKKLELAGIHTPEDLVNTGSEQALIRIRAFDDTGCFNMLCALEGAIRGIRWHDLPAERKEELKAFLRLKNIPLSPIKTAS